MLDGVESFGHGRGVSRFHAQLDDVFFAGGNVGFTLYDFTVVHQRGEADVGRGCGVDMASRGEDFCGQTDGLGEISRHLRKRGDEEVAEAVAFEAGTGAKSMAEEAGDEVLIFREGNHAVAQVAGRKHVEVFPQPATRAAVVGDSNDRSEMAEKAWVPVTIRLSNAGRRDVALESAEQGGEACAAAHSDDSQVSLLRGPQWRVGNGDEGRLLHEQLNKSVSEEAGSWFVLRSVEVKLLIRRNHFLRAQNQPCTGQQADSLRIGT